ncbi:hypothetical protein D3C87_798010 [compost metagenome]
MAHVGLHDRQTEMRDHLVQFVGPLLVGRHLGAQVGQVLPGIAGRPAGARQQGQCFRLAQQTRGAVDQLEIVDQHALFLDARGVGRHGAWRGAADIGMVAARADIEQDGAARFAEHGRDHRHVGQMRAAVVRVVQHVDVARPHGARIARHDGADALAHGTQVHGHVRRVGDQMALRVEDGAAEIEPLLDVDGMGRILQAQPHLLGDRHEQVIENFQHHGVGIGPHGAAFRQSDDPAQDQMAVRRHFRAPARLDDRGGIGVADDGRAIDSITRAQAVRRIQAAWPPRAGAVHVHRLHGRQPTRARRMGRRGHSRRIGRADGFHGNGFDDQRTRRHQKGKAFFVGRFELRLHAGHRIEQHDEGRIRAFVAQVHARHQRDAFLCHALAQQVATRQFTQLREIAGQVRAQGRFDGALAHRALVGQAHAVGRHHARQAVDEHRAHAQRIGHQAGMLAARAAKAGQGVFGDVVAALHGNLLDGVGHVADRDGDIAFGHLLRRRIHRARQRFELGPHGGHVQRFIGVGAEDAGEERRLQFAQHDVAVGDGQRAAAPVAGGAGIGARAVRPHLVAGAVEMQDGAAARGHRVDAHHGRAHAHAGDLRLEHAFELAYVMRHIGGRAAHVEADDFIETGQRAGAHHADDAAGGTGQNAVLALEGARIRQAAVRLHELQVHTGQFDRQLVDVAAQNRRQIGVDHRGVATRHQFHHGTDLVRHGHLRKTGLARQLRHPRLVRVMAVAVHQHDRDGAHAASISLFQRRARGRLVERGHDVAVGAHSFIDLDHVAVQQFRQGDLAREQLRAVLVGDAQGVAETARDGEHGRLALAFEQRIGRHRRAHLDGAHQFDGQRRTGRQVHQLAHACQRRVAVLARVFRQQFMRGQAAVRTARHDVRKGAAPVDPELPVHRLAPVLV